MILQAIGCIPAPLPRTCRWCMNKTSRPEIPRFLPLVLYTRDFFSTIIGIYRVYQTCNTSFINSTGMERRMPFPFRFYEWRRPNDKLWIENNDSNHNLDGIRTRTREFINLWSMRNYSHLCKFGKDASRRLPIAKCTSGNYSEWKPPRVLCTLNIYINFHTSIFLSVSSFLYLFLRKLIETGRRCVMKLQYARGSRINIRRKTLWRRDSAIFQNENMLRGISWGKLTEIPAVSLLMSRELSCIINDNGPRWRSRASYARRKSHEYKKV